MPTKGIFRGRHDVELGRQCDLPARHVKLSEQAADAEEDATFVIAHDRYDRGGLGVGDRLDAKAFLLLLDGQGSDPLTHFLWE